MGRFLLTAVQRLAAPVFLLLATGALATGLRLHDIESTLRGRPEAALAALNALSALDEKTPALATANVQERVHTLLLRATLHQRLADEEGLVATAAALDRLAPGEALAGAAAQLVRGIAWSRQKPLGRADRAMTEALAALPADTPLSLRLRFVAPLAGVRQSLGKIDQAVALYQEVVQLADQVGIPWRRAESRSALAYALYLARQVDRAQAVNAEATALARQAQDLYAQAIAANTDAILYSALKRDAEELHASQQAIELARRAGAQRLLALCTANLADFYLKRGDYNTALTLALQALPLAREVRDPSSESVSLINAGLAKIGLGRIDEGKALVQQALVIEERTAGLPGMAAAQSEFGWALEKAGRLPEAWAAWVEHRRLSDIVFQREHQLAVLELQEGLDADRRKRELAALETSQSLTQAQLLARELQQRLWLLGLVVGVLLLALVALLLQRMRRSNVQLQQTNALLKVAGEVDPLTGLANRRHFQALMKETAATHFQGSLLLVDLDHFKRVNDMHGHSAGDAVLVAMAQRLQQALRPEDLTVRWGGEEFLVCVRYLPQEQVEALAERLLGTLGGAPVLHAGVPILVTASIGFATFPLAPAREPVGWERAVDLVDTALYLAKAHGRNRAYGVRSLRPVQGDGERGSRLEQAWRDGDAELAHLAGPARQEAPP